MSTEQPGVRTAGTATGPPPRRAAGRPLWQWGATQVTAATRSGEVSAIEVTRSVLDRIAEVNPHLNAITLELADAALARAAELDDSWTRAEPIGPLHGVPITIKDNVDVAGQRTPNGLAGLAGRIAPDDSPVTRNLLRAGAVLVGRTNTPEKSMRPTTDNPLFGLTLNPWDDATSCGGSSGGAGASVAAGMGALGHGNDIGGSLRIPALHCGVPAIKPSQGRVPAFVPSDPVERSTIAQLMSVQGLLGRSVADLRIGLAAASVRDVRDPWWTPAPLEGPPVPRRAAVLRSLDDEQPTDPSVLTALDRAAEALSAAGYDVVELTEDATPGLGRVGWLALRLMMADLDHQLAPEFERLGSAAMREYWAVTGGLTQPYRSLGEHVDDLAARTTLQRRWLLFLEQYPVLVAPEMLGPLLAVGEDVRSADDTRRVWRGLLPSIAVNLLGLPAALAPTGLAPSGLPTGVQLIASRWREDVALAAAEAIEAAVGPLPEQYLWPRTLS
jgi:amidase